MTRNKDTCDPPGIGLRYLGGDGCVVKGSNSVGGWFWVAWGLCITVLAKVLKS